MRPLRSECDSPFQSLTGGPALSSSLDIFWGEDTVGGVEVNPHLGLMRAWLLSGYHADTPITIKAEPFIWPTAAFINIHEHPL